MDGKEFLQRMNKGDGDAVWGELLPVLDQMIVRSVVKYYPSLAQESDDIAQAVISKFFEDWRKFKGNSNVKTYVFSMMRNHCSQLINSDQQFNALLSSFADSGRPMVSPELSRCVKKTIAALIEYDNNNTRKNAVPLSETLEWIIRNEGYSIKEFADEFGIEESAAKYRIGALRKMMTTLCDEHCGTDHCKAVRY